ncbi:hypothetical protein B0H13DRAFT_1913098 [Mycena leptocephala]|nr:hypothetical protein B0H13DRAFT_1913098 [Mycena leptocephala]
MGRSLHSTDTGFEDVQARRRRRTCSLSVKLFGLFTGLGLRWKRRLRVASTTKHDNLATTAKKLGVYVILWIHNAHRAPGLRLQVSLLEQLCTLDLAYCRREATPSWIHPLADLIPLASIYTTSNFRCVSFFELIGYFHPAIVLHFLSYSTVGDRFALCRIQKCGPGTFSNATIISGSSPPLCHGVRIPPTAARPASRPTLQSPKHRPPAHDANIFYCFRKPRSKLGPHCPAQTFDVHAPIPRTTSDSTTISTYFHAPVLVLGASAPRCTGRSVDARHHYRGQAGGARDEVAQRRAVESARGRSEVDIIGGRSAAAVPALSARGAGFGLARNGRTGLWIPVCGIFSVSANRTLGQQIISLFSTFSSTSPGNRVNVLRHPDEGQDAPRALRQGASLCGSRCPHALTPTPEAACQPPLLDHKPEVSYRPRLARPQLLFYLPGPFGVASTGRTSHGPYQHPHPHTSPLHRRVPRRLAVPPNKFPSSPPPNVDFCGFPAPPTRNPDEAREESRALGLSRIADGGAVASTTPRRTPTPGVSPFGIAVAISAGCGGRGDCVGEEDEEEARTNAFYTIVRARHTPRFFSRLRLVDKTAAPAPPAPPASASRPPSQDTALSLHAERSPAHTPTSTRTTRRSSPPLRLWVACWSGGRTAERRRVRREGCVEERTGMRAGPGGSRAAETETEGADGEVCTSPGRA